LREQTYVVGEDCKIIFFVCWYRTL